MLHVFAKFFCQNLFGIGFRDSSDLVCIEDTQLHKADTIIMEAGHPVTVITMVHPQSSPQIVLVEDTLESQIMNGKDLFNSSEFLAVTIERSTKERDSSSVPVMGMNNIREEIESF